MRWLFLLSLSACAPASVQSVTVDDWRAWIYVPPDLEGPAPAVFHLHHSGEGRAQVDSAALQRDLDAAGLIGVFPEGGGEPGDDWRVGRNKDDIPRDDRAFLAEVARKVRARGDVDSVWLGGFSKGGAMTYDMACLGEDVFDGFLPMSGAMEDRVFEECPAAQRPIRHLQGRRDDRWPVNTADDPESSHKGIVESLLALQDDAACMETSTEEGDCVVWTGCDRDTRLCFFDGGHGEPDGFFQGHRAWIDSLER